MTKRASTTVRYETSTTIDRPVGDVFGRLIDLNDYTTWMRRTGLFRRSGQTTGGPLGLGTAYFDATRMGTFHGEVTDYEPPARIGFRETLRWFGSDLMEARPRRVQVSRDWLSQRIRRLSRWRYHQSRKLGVIMSGVFYTRSGSQRWRWRQRSLNWRRTR